MFPHLPLLPPVDSGEAGLIALGEAMIEERIDPTTTGTLNTPKAGFTYLGQFIDHDLTLDLTPLDLARGSDLSRVVNFRNPQLDLEHVYGATPDIWAFLYRQAGLRSAPQLLVGQTAANSINGQPLPASENDLPRSSDGIALVGDPRQDENLIIAQLQVAFLKLHNAIINNADYLGASQHYQNAGSVFDAARRVLTWHYQWIVRHDYLRQILDGQVFNDLDRVEQTIKVVGADFQIPVEFSLGAFRFGHSMVRQEYFYNDHHSEAQLLEDLLTRTGGGGGAVPALPADWVIDWKRFFFVGAGSGTAQHSSAFDTQLAKGLHTLPTGPRGSAHLPVRTLQRGERVGLPSGQAVAISLGVPHLSSEQMLGGRHSAILAQYGYEKQTPLWYYILREAEVLGNRERLGPAGSHIIARIILGALLNDPRSYLSVDRSWVPTLPGPATPELYGMAELLRIILPRI